MKNSNDADVRRTIELLQVNFLRGPNLWTYRSVLEVWLDLGALEDYPSNRLPGFNDRLLALLPALAEHHCGVGERGGFLQRLTEGTWCGHILEHAVIELLNLADMPTGFGQTRSTSKRGIYRMVFRARDEKVARCALDAGHRLMHAALNAEPFDVPAAVAAIRDQIDDSWFGPSTAAIVAAATERGIPHLRLNDGNLVQLGHGARQRRIWTAETEMTSAIAEGIARDKDLTKRLIRTCGVPVPEGIIAKSPSEAWEAAQDLGLPVVVKPTDGNHGRGVTLDLNRREDIEAAWHVAERHGSDVLVETFIRGDEHRLLVVGNRVVAAARGESAWITGDGRSTVIELIDLQLNTDPRRGTTEAHPLARLVPAEDEVIMADLQRQGLTPESVPDAGRQVLIQRNGNVAIDCTDDVHPEVEHAVVLAARVVGLDIAGIDVVAQDIGRPLQEQGGAVVEVNAGPGLLMHLKPAVGMPRPVGRAIVDHLFPPAGNDRDDGAGRITLVGVAGTRGTTGLTRLLAWLLQLAGHQVGLACRDGVFLGARRIERCDGTAYTPASRLLINRSITAAVFESSPETILKDGLPYDRCAIGVVTDFEGSESLARYDIQESDQLARVLRTQVDVVLASGAAVLNAADPRVAALAPLCDGTVTLYGVDPRLPAMSTHREQGRRVVFLREGRVVLAEGSVETVGPLMSAAHRADAEAALAAAATGWALGLSPQLIGAALDTRDHNVVPT